MSEANCILILYVYEHLTFPSTFPIKLDISKFPQYHLPTTPPGRPLHSHHNLVHLLPTRLPRNRRSMHQTLQPPQMGHPSLRFQQHHLPAPPASPIPRRSRHPVRPGLLLGRCRPRQILLPRQRHDLKLPNLRPGSQIPRLPRRYRSLLSRP
jgi:hypothetical protein